jgi:VanZ family protein
VVALFSSQSFSAGHTGSFLKSILAWLHVKVTATEMLALHYAIRKCAHFTAYGVLSALFFRAVRGPERRSAWQWSWALITLAICLATASADEIHQAFTPGREGNYRDVLLDMAGATFVQLVILVVYVVRRKRNQ